MSDTASVHDPLGVHLPMQLAEQIGQLQHIIELLEATAGPNHYDPIPVDLAGLTAATVNLPAEACELVQATISTSVAATFKLYRVAGNAGDLNGPAGKLVGQVYIPAGGNAPLPLDCPIPPGGCQLIITASAAVTIGAVTLVLRRVRSGGYPYAQ